MIRRSRSRVPLRGALLTCVLALVASLSGTMLVAPAAQAVGSFNNAVIADRALAYPDGSVQGQCKVFVNNVVRESTGIRLSGYHAGYQAAGGVEVSRDAATKGDIIQVGNSDSDWPLHTAIVLENRGGGNFWVIDSNWSPSKVLRHAFNPYSWAPRSNIKIWRLGTVSAGPRPRDLNGDGRADLVIAGTASTGSGRLEAHAMNAATGYSQWFLHAATPHGYLDATQRLVMGDVNADGRADMVVVNTGPTGSGRLEAHVLNGASSFGVWQSHSATPAGYGASTDRYLMGDVNGDGHADLIIVGTKNTGSGRLEVHVLNGATAFNTWLFHWATAHGYIGETDRVVAGDVNADGRADLTIVGTLNTGSGRLEAHTMDAASGYGSWLFHAATPHGYIDAKDRIAMGDVDGDGRADLSIIGTGPTGSGRLEAHVLSGASSFNSWLAHWATAAGYIGSSDVVLMAG